MKKVWSSPSLVQCDLVKAMLESDGIDCVMQNENAARFTGIGTPLSSGQALGFAWPELWVPDDRFDEAKERVETFSQMHERTLEGNRNEDVPPDVGDA
jgi:hypothetical protein